MNQLTYLYQIDGPGLRLGFYAHFLVYLIVSGVFFIANVASDIHHPWFLWPVLGWGASLLIHGVTIHLYTREP